MFILEIFNNLCYCLKEMSGSSNFFNFFSFQGWNIKSFIPDLKNNYNNNNNNKVNYHLQKKNKEKNEDIGGKIESIPYKDLQDWEEIPYE